MRVIFTGSRDWEVMIFPDPVVLWLKHLHQIQEEARKEVVIVHGAGGKLDGHVQVIASAMGLSVESHPANWAFHGKFAGPKRNQEMVDAGAELCLAFVNKPLEASRGTHDCVKRAQRAGIKAIVTDVWAPAAERTPQAVHKQSPVQRTRPIRIKRTRAKVDSR